MQMHGNYVKTQTLLNESNNSNQLLKDKINNLKSKAKRYKDEIKVLKRE